MKINIKNNLNIYTQYSSIEEVNKQYELIKSRLAEHYKRGNYWELQKYRTTSEYTLPNTKDMEDWKILYENMIQELEATGELSDTPRLKKMKNVCGGETIVANMLKGLPKSMVDVKKINSKSKIIDFVIDITSSCAGCSILSHNYWPANTRDYTMALLLTFAYVHLLEKRGWQCNVKYTFIKALEFNASTPAFIRDSMESLRNVLLKNDKPEAQLGMQYMNVFDAMKHSLVETNFKDPNQKVSFKKFKKNLAFQNIFKLKLGISDNELNKLLEFYRNELSIILDFRVASHYDTWSILQSDLYLPYGNSQLKVVEKYLKNSSAVSREFNNIKYNFDGILNSLRGVLLDINHNQTTNHKIEQIIVKLKNLENQKFKVGLQKGYTWEYIIQGLKNLIKMPQLFSKKNEYHLQQYIVNLLSTIVIKIKKDGEFEEFITTYSNDGKYNFIQDLEALYVSSFNDGFKSHNQENFQYFNEKGSRVLVVDTINIKSSTKRLSFENICNIVNNTQNLIGKLHKLHFINPFILTIANIQKMQGKYNFIKNLEEWYDMVDFGMVLLGKFWGNQYTLTEILLVEKELASLSDNNIIFFQSVVDYMKFTRNNHRDSNEKVFSKEILQSENPLFIRQFINLLTHRTLRKGEILWKNKKI